MANTPHKSTLDGLPKPFVNSLRVLFEILDEKKVGYVRLTDIEDRWQDGSAEGLPKGVVEALRKVTPGSGNLSFERFVAGLKIALLRNKGDNGTRPSSSASGTEITPGARAVPDLLQSHGHGSRSATQRYLPVTARRTTSASDVIGLSQNQKHIAPNTATVRPQNVMADQRAKSMPQLQATLPPSREHSSLTPPPDLGRSLPPPAAFHPESRGNWNPYASAVLPDAQNRNSVSFALKQWQAERIMSETGQAPPLDFRRGLGDGRASIASTTALDQLGKCKYFLKTLEAL